MSLPESSNAEEVLDVSIIERACSKDDSCNCSGSGSCNCQNVALLRHVIVAYSPAYILDASGGNIEGDNIVLDTSSSTTIDPSMQWYVLPGAKRNSVILQNVASELYVGTEGGRLSVGKNVTLQEKENATLFTITDADSLKFYKCLRVYTDKNLALGFVSGYNLGLLQQFDKNSYTQKWAIYLR